MKTEKILTDYIKVICQGLTPKFHAVIESSTNSLQPTAYFPNYDANGNITEYVDTNATTVAHYEYGPFGNTINQTGSLSSNFVFRFSTKYLDEEIYATEGGAGLYYYGKRYYSSDLGRWISRDPIREDGGLNVYAFVENNSVDVVDFLGKSVVQTSPFKSTQQISPLGTVSMKLNVTCPINGVTLGYVNVSFGFDSDPTTVSEKFIKGLKWYVAQVNRQLRGQVYHKDYLGAYVVLSFYITNQKELERCCCLGGSDASDAGWIQYTKGNRRLDQRTSPGVPNPFFSKTPYKTLADMPGWRYSNARAKYWGGWSDKFWDELRCSKPRKRRSAYNPRSYPLLLLNGSKDFKWSYRMFVTGTLESPTANGKLWYNEHE